LLHTFAEIVEHGTFTHAANRVHRTQSAVSMQIKRLEEQLGCRLFERNGRAMRLTGQGEIFYDHACRILRSYREALAAINGRSLEGDITVGLPDDYASSFLPHILARFKQTYPWVGLHLVCEPSRRLVSQFADGLIDVALVTEGEGALGGIVVRREPLVWVAAARNDIHTRDPVPLAIFHTGDVFRRYAVDQLEAHGRHAKIAATSPSFAGIAAAVDAGIAVAAVFRNSVKPGWRILGACDGFPELPELGIVLLETTRADHQVVRQLTNHIAASLRDLP
jgi:DNA-binding transcriptional LysR family regulator